MFEPPFEPKDMSDVEFAFPAHVVGVYLPEEKYIPHDFLRFKGGKWTHLADIWFAQGLKGEHPLKVRKEFDERKVVRHLGCCLKSFQPRHEHKIGGVGYLMSLWLDEDQPVPGYDK